MVQFPYTLLNMFNSFHPHAGSHRSNLLSEYKYLCLSVLQITHNPVCHVFRITCVFRYECFAISSFMLYVFVECHILPFPCLRCTFS